MKLRSLLDAFLRRTDGLFARMLEVAMHCLSQGLTSGREHLQHGKCSRKGGLFSEEGGAIFTARALAKFIVDQRCVRKISVEEFCALVPRFEWRQQKRRGHAA